MKKNGPKEKIEKKPTANHFAEFLKTINSKYKFHEAILFDWVVINRPVDHIYKRIFDKERELNSDGRGWEGTEYWLRRNMSSFHPPILYLLQITASIKKRHAMESVKNFDPWNEERYRLFMQWVDGRLELEFPDEKAIPLTNTKDYPRKLNWNVSRGLMFKIMRQLRRDNKPLLTKTLDKKLKWNTDQIVLFSIIRQLKKGVNSNKENLLNNTHDEIAHFVIDNFEGFQHLSLPTLAKNMAKKAEPMKHRINIIFT